MEEKDRRCPRGKLHCFNWLEDIPGTSTEYDIVEVQFKNTRKDRKSVVEGKSVG